MINPDVLCPYCGKPVAAHMASDVCLQLCVCLVLDIPMPAPGLEVLESAEFREFDFEITHFRDTQEWVIDLNEEDENGRWVVKADILSPSLLVAVSIALCVGHAERLEEKKQEGYPK